MRALHTREVTPATRGRDAPGLPAWMGWHSGPWESLAAKDRYILKTAHTPVESLGIQRESGTKMPRVRQADAPTDRSVDAQLFTHSGAAPAEAAQQSMQQQMQV